LYMTRQSVGPTVKAVKKRKTVALPAHFRRGKFATHGFPSAHGVGAIGCGPLREAAFTPGRGGAVMTRMQRWTVTLGVLSLSVGCDQATKRVAVQMLKDGPVHSFLMDTFRLQYAENPGAFMSLGANLPSWARQGLFTVGVGVLLLGFAVAALSIKALPLSRVAALAALAGGGFGNWMDRVMSHGVVVDFLNIGVGPVRTGIFNVADVAIMVGALFLAIPVKGASSPGEMPPPPDGPSTAPPANPTSSGGP